MFKRKRSTNDFDEEMRAHLALEADELESEGLNDQEARRRAHVAFGNVQAAHERFYLKSRPEWIAWLDNLARDLKYALRQLLRHPGFTLTATLTLALGIGANTAIFTVIQSVLLAPLPYVNPNRLALLETHWTDSGHTAPRMTGPDAVDVRDQAKGLEAVSLFAGGNEGVELRDHATYTEVTWVDENFTRVFSLRPIAGRLFADAESHRAALVSEKFARDNFGGAQAALGQTLHIESEAIEIVGVLGGGFDYPGKTDVWEAFPLKPDSTSRTAFNYRAVALLAAGTSFKQAQAELNGLSQRLQTIYPADNRAKVIEAVPLAEALTGSARPTLLLLWGTVGIILLIACVNVTHLQLVRAMERQREIAIAKALGACRWQVMRPVLIESLLLAVLGGAAGVLLAAPAVHILVAMAPRELPRAAEIHLNTWVLAFTLGIAALTALAASIFPAMRAARVEAAEALKHDASRGISRRGAATLRDSLVIAEVAATFVLAIGAGLLLRSMAALMARDLGFETRQLLVVDADAPAHTDVDYQRVIQQFNGLFAQLGAMPGVQHAAGIMGLPMGAYGSNGNYWTHRQAADPTRAPWANWSVASPGYFETMGITLKRGRDFSAADTYQSPFVAVISESAAKQSFGDTDPIGKQIRCGLDSDKWMTVIGVVGDVRQDSPADKPGPALYMPMTQHPYYANQIHIMLRTRVAPLTLMNAVQTKIAQINPLIAMKFTTMDAMVSDSITVQRFRAVLISLFAGAGLLLAMLGVYGTTAYSVAQRTVEIGIRMAFGADRRVIISTILRHATALACGGIVVGLALSLLLVRLVASMLVGVHPIDPLSIGAAAALLLLTALAASSAPAWRATHVDPVEALRAE
ncbi:MAG TPA: ABC transporter permease [Terracidiphilus sp.]|nr:ABC transporter permease [Terracidiphilus sp.]